MTILPQILLNGLIAGSLIALIALGLNLVYGNMKFMNFAHGEMAMLGAYFYYLFRIKLEWAPGLSMPLALVLCALAGLLLNRLVFNPLKKESQWTLLIASVGVSMCVKFAVMLVAGSFTLNYVIGSYVSHSYKLAGGALIITQNQIFILISTLMILLGLHGLLKYSKLGKAIRAVSDNMQLATVVGIDVSRTIDWIFILSSTIAGFAGILIAYEQSLSPQMGLVFSILAFAAIIMGGLGSVWGAVVGGFLIGFLQNLLVGIDWGLFSIPTSYKSAVAFGIMILFLLFRPRGLFGINLEEDKTSKA